MTQNDRDILKQEAELAATGLRENYSIDPVTVLELIADYDALFDENHDLIEDCARLQDDVTNLQDALELGEEEAA